MSDNAYGMRPDRIGSRRWMQPMLLVGLGAVAAAAAWIAPEVELRFSLLAAAGGCLAAAALVSLRDLVRAWRAGSARRAAFALIMHDTTPCFCTDAEGNIVLHNAAAAERFGNRTGLPMARALAGLLPNAAAVVFRQESAVARRAFAQEVVTSPRGTLRLTTHRLNDGALWRLEELAEHPQRQGEWIGLPMMVVSQNDTVITLNAAMREMLGRRATHLEEVFADLPLVPGRSARINAADGKTDVIPIVVPARDGRREIYAVPGLAEPPTASVAARAFETLPVALLHIGSDGQVLASNRYAQTLLGIGPQDTGTLSAFVEGLGRPVNDWVMDSLAERMPNRSEVARARRRSEECFLQITLSRIVDASGPSLLAMLHDATELKTLEQQFVQSQKMQAIGELAGGVAHDFNNLLTAITGHCDLLLLRHDQGDPDFADLVQINQNANRAASLVRQLLAFSRKQMLEPEILDLRDSMGELTHLLNRLVGEKVHLRLTHDPALMPIRADRRQLDQVIMNLVVNARDAMPNGGEIAVETRMIRLTETMSRDRAVVPPGQYVAILVRDQGHGIPPDKLGRIFEPFFTTKRTGEGTGLGLSMAYGIVKQSGGYIFVDSVVNSGSTFTIYIPAHDHPEEQAATSAPVAVLAPTLTRRRADTPAVLLLVEDEAPVRAFASRALRLRGYTVLEAGTAEEALETLEDADLEIDLFVTDVVMPGMDGPTWVRAARKARPEVGVVFVSGYAEEALTEGTIDMPNAVFLPKPFSLSALTETVKRQLG